MSRDRVRAALIALFATAAILCGVGNTSGRRWLTALGFICFAAGAVVLLRWRQRNRNRARVLDYEDKTGSDREDKTGSNYEETTRK